MRPNAKMWLGAACVLVVLILLSWREHPDDARTGRVATGGAEPGRAPAASDERPQDWERIDRSLKSPEGIVQDKVAQFGRSRRTIAHALAKRHGIAVPPEVDEFFNAVESGDWERIQSAFQRINGGDESASHAGTRAPEVTQMWPAIIDAFGAAEQAHLWPAQELLDYGHSILDALKPGMVYVGGTDASRWIPALLNDTLEGPGHVVLTQNAFADNLYLEYARLQFGERLNLLTEDDSRAAFSEYIQDAQRRLLHDQEFPDEPKQIRPGENVSIVDARISVSGRTAVFDINERLLKTLLAKNPDRSFAVGESVPMPGTYADAVPLGPLMELRADAKPNFTRERAEESVQHWRDAANRLIASSGASASESALKSYSHDAVAAANLLSAHNYQTEAEETYQLARRLWPSNPETVAGLYKLHQQSGRSGEAQRLLEQFLREYPAQEETLKDLGLFRRTGRTQPLQ